MKKHHVQQGELLFFAGVAAVGFLLFLGAPPLFDWDEINFAESAREMLVTGDFFRVQINYEPFWEKPPLFFWLQALSMKIFGVNEFAARFPNAIIGIATILLLYITGTRLKDRLFGKIVAGLYMATLLPVAYFKSGIIDPTFNFFIFLGLMQIFAYDRLFQTDRTAANKDASPWGAGFWIGIATLAKGPVALLITGLVYVLYKAIFDKFRIPWLAAGKFFLAWLILVFGWYGIETLVHGSWFIDRFFEYQIGLLTKGVAGHEQPFYYHTIVFLLGCFPMAAFTFRGMFDRSGNDDDRQLRGLMIVWFWVVMVVFSIVTTKIIHYSSLLYFPGAFLAAFYLYRQIREDEKLSWDVYLIWSLGALVWGLTPALVNAVANNVETIAGMLSDPMAVASLRMEVSWSGWEWIVGAVFLVGLIYTLFLLIQKKYLIFIWVQVALTLLFVNAQYKVLVPKVARYTQGAPQDFFEGVATRDVYVMTVGYKSYLPYFYGKVKPPTDAEKATDEWLIEGPVDKDVYLSTKVTRIDAAFLRRFRNFERLYEKGGFAFFRRTAEIPLRAVNE